MQEAVLDTNPSYRVNSVLSALLNVSVAFSRNVKVI